MEKINYAFAVSIEKHRQERRFINGKTCPKSFESCFLENRRNINNDGFGFHIYWEFGHKFGSRVLVERKEKVQPNKTVYTILFCICIRYILSSCAIYQSDVKEGDGKCLNGKP